MFLAFYYFIKAGVNRRMTNYLYILGTVLFTVYGQLIIKWRVTGYGSLPDGLIQKLFFLFKLFLDPLILSGFFAAFVASLFWMAAMTKFELSHAYPFMALNFIFVFILSGFLFSEAITIVKVIGLTLIVVGIVVGSQG